MLQPRTRAILLALGIVFMMNPMLNAGCVIPGTYHSTIYIHTWTQEHDLLFGITNHHDPNRGYWGGRTTNVEKLGYTTVSGSTNSFADDTRNQLSVPNKWTFVNTNGACFNETTYNNRLVHLGLADLRCKIDTGYNQSQYVVMGLEGETVDGNYQYISEPTDLGTNFLSPYEDMHRNEALQDGTGYYSLILLDDGNLVHVYNGLYTQFQTYTSSGAHLRMQGDGNLVLFDSGWNAIWSTNTWGNPGAYLNVQDDGNLVVYSATDVPLWSLW